MTLHAAEAIPSHVPVLVVGAGPTGLMLGAELALHGSRPLVIDALPSPSGQSRALGFTVRTLEIFKQRGILGRFQGLAPVPGVHFAGLSIKGDHLSSSMRPANQYPQSKTEQVLAAWAEELGVPVRRPWTLTSMEPTGTGYRCVLSGPAGQQTVDADYVVGCDGAGSFVREAIGMPTKRTPPSVQMLLGDLRGCGLPDEPFGVKHEKGMVMSAPLGDGTERVIVCDFTQPMRPQGTPVTHDEIKAAYEQVVGSPLADGECLWASSFSDASSLVESYRSGRALLVGDTAHTHLPAGGQGMNVSIQDAVNVGWKLALVSQGRAPDTLLDTYHAERYPVGRELLLNTAAQGQVFLRGPEVDPLREVLRRLLNIREVSVLLADGVSGLDIRYDMGLPEAPPPTGERLPPDVFHVVGTGGDAVEELRHGAALLIVPSPDSPASSLVAPWRDQVRVVHARPTDPDWGGEPAASSHWFVRPDGHIAWAGTEFSELSASLSRWLGQPAA
uniref:Putative FAD-dependent oxygenase n=1 Tax=Streptomyces griseoflavus TaxID=35619 RepID=Q7X2G6_9ACTN|nr:putative FAD-dependent oxygenase [Streptomyces griseoflavus]